eukprot:scaffold25347_cov86-Skeletonema_dohrnii-CCMP3373.AAC.2
MALFTTSSLAFGSVLFTILVQSSIPHSIGSISNARSCTMNFLFFFLDLTPLNATLVQLRFSGSVPSFTSLSPHSSL